MERTYSGGMSWADQWDYTMPDPPLPPPSDDHKGEKCKEDSKGKSGLRKIKTWFKDLGSKRK